MPLYLNPDFRRLPSELSHPFNNSAEDRFFTVAVWYDVMTRYGLPAKSETRIYTDELPEPAVALLLRNTAPEGRRLTSLANAYSVEHGIVYRPGADFDAGLAAILSEILSER